MPMNEVAFAELVAEEVKGKVADAQREYLRLPENLHRWYEALGRLVANLESQIDVIAAREAEAKSRFDSDGDSDVRGLAELIGDLDLRSRRINRFRFFVEQRLEEVAEMLGADTERISERAGLVEFLRTAIERHQRLIRDFGIEPTAIDTALWAALDGRWCFDEVRPADVTDLAS